ncbi:hypothetical protein XA68_11763 [Ophiocordyceps unilateralis]|uniref:Uncharacterized protein n=1 Tax=Ophiocordyceps unilateralis TaxID=268505 RepID=A0A2A9PFT0_OPHUN|nr:hypothetical protein XA68_11763 [Ophiocordyceps unilateralis]
MRLKSMDPFAADGNPAKTLNVASVSSRPTVALPACFGRLERSTMASPGSWCRIVQNTPKGVERKYCATGQDRCCAEA